MPPILCYNRVVKENMNLKGGALLIGSLYWQDDLVLDSGDNIRQIWRQERLEMSSAIDVQVPIRYGRFSMRNTYTMIFDKKVANGTAKVIPFKNSNITLFNEIYTEVTEISKAEGVNDETFIKGERAWCVCTILFNPRLDENIRTDILQKWKVELERNPRGYEYFINNTERYSVKISGELDVPWPSEAAGFDFLIATATKEKKREGAGLITPQEIAQHVKNRPYFYPNIEHGIVTFEDAEILRFL